MKGRIGDSAGRGTAGRGGGCRDGAEPEMRGRPAGGEAGIVDGEALRLSLRIDAENRGAFVTEDGRLIAVYPMARGFELDLAGQPGELTTLRCEILINAAEAAEAYQTASGSMA